MVWLPDGEKKFQDIFILVLTECTNVMHDGIGGDCIASFGNKSRYADNFATYIDDGSTRFTDRHVEAYICIVHGRRSTFTECTG